MQLITGLVTVALLLGTSAAAQTQITPKAFLDEAEGKTLTFTSVGSGRLAGVEQFLSRTQSVWAAGSGRCTYGVVEVRGPHLCFIYEDNPDPLNCWALFREQGELLVMSIRSQQTQRVTAITERPVICEDTPIS